MSCTSSNKECSLKESSRHVPPATMSRLLPLAVCLTASELKDGSFWPFRRTTNTAVPQTAMIKIKIAITHACLFHGSLFRELKIFTYNSYIHIFIYLFIWYLWFVFVFTIHISLYLFRFCSFSFIYYIMISTNHLSLVIHWCNIFSLCSLCCFRQ